MVRLKVMRMRISFFVRRKRLLLNATNIVAKKVMTFKRYKYCNRINVCIFFWSTCKRVLFLYGFLVRTLNKERDMTMKKKERLYFRVTEEEKRLLMIMAKRKEITASELIRRCIREMGAKEK